MISGKIQTTLDEFLHPRNEIDNEAGEEADVDVDVDMDM